MTIRFGTKAETLERLYPVIKSAKILPQIRCTVDEWERASDRVIQHIKEKDWFDIPLIVRSSGISEDTGKESLAGHFLSVLDVKGELQINDAINQVIQSFNSRKELKDQVFMQPMLQEVMWSGVAFSREPSTGGFYIVINYDDSGSTSSVTSGHSSDAKVFYYYKHSAKLPEGYTGQIIEMIYELEELLKTDALDIEFALTSQEELYLLQVRPLILHTQIENDETLNRKALKDIETKILKFNRPHPYLHGSRTVYGVMPDWNPAEIIGIRPRQLALSMYKEIITDNIWAYQRDNYGYKNLRSFPLIITFAGLPYIDVRVSFNSFIPKDVDAGLAKRMVNYYIDRLIESPSYHDKVEFEVVYSCYTLDLPDRIKVLKNYGFTQNDCEHFSESLRTLTNKIIHGESGLWRKDIDKISVLEERHKTIQESDLDIVSKIYWILEDCKRYGTLPFAGLARAGFIAVQLLKSLVNVGILDHNGYEDFMLSLDTVSSGISDDLQNLSRKTFLKKYGHLRPGTYDILSPRYDEAPERYFDWVNVQQKNDNKEHKFTLSLQQLKQTENILKEHQLVHNVIELFDFIKEAIEGREFSKFIFTRSLSDALSLFKEMAQAYGFSNEDCSYANINCVQQLYASSEDIKEVLEKSIEEGKRKYSLTRQITLPPVIMQAEDVWAFHIPATEPNFITLKTASGHVAFSDESKNKLKNSILMIPNADPGYDWIFSHRISGFITMYGGANSHMAIRAGELGIPAVIGAGETLYKKWTKGKKLEIDSASKQVRILQ